MIKYEKGALVSARRYIGPSTQDIEDSWKTRIYTHTTTNRWEGYEVNVGDLGIVIRSLPERCLVYWQKIKKTRWAFHYMIGKPDE